MQLNRRLPLRVPSCQLFLAVSFCLWAAFPSTRMIVLKKHNATVCERMLVRIEKSHPHYSTTRSDAPACTASLLTVPTCTYFIPSCILENTPISAVSHLCHCAANGLVSHSALHVLYECLVYLEWLHIYNSGCNWFEFYYWRVTQGKEQVCHEKVSS